MPFDPPPGFSDTDPPDLWRMSAAEFEAFCRSLTEQEPGIENCEQYGTPGQTQFGIDLLAHRTDGLSLTVGQCKCHKEFEPQDIRDASDDFFEYWESYWKPRGVKRFILFVACEMRQQKRQEQILAEKERFEKKGVVYHCWPRRTLLQKTAPWPHVVAAHFTAAHDGYWIKRLTGRAPVPFTVGGEAAVSVRSLADEELRSLIRRAEEGFSHALSGVRDLIRRGRIGDAVARLEATRSDVHVWTKLDGPVRADTLRLQAKLSLEASRDAVDAKRLVAEARAIDRMPDPATDALIVHSEHGPEGVLDYLGDGTPTEGDLRRLKASCLLQLGRPQEAIACIGETAASSDADMQRVLAMALSAVGRRSQAVDEARKAVAGVPDSWIARMTLAIVLYACAHSAAAPAALGAWPPPTAWFLVRRDDASVQFLAEAHSLFSGLLTDGQDRASKNDLEGWMMACLADDAGRRAEAEAFAAKLFRDDPAHPAALAWSLARGVPFDRSRARRQLGDLLDGGKGNIHHAVALVSLDLDAGHGRKAVKSLRKRWQMFADAGATEFYRFMLAQAEHVSGVAGAAPSGTKSVDVALSAMRAAADGDMEAGSSALETLAAECAAPGGPIAELMECLRPLAVRGRWTAVACHAEALVDRIGTADAARLAAIASFNTGDYVGALAILERSAVAFPGTKLPPEMRAIRLDSLKSLGRLREAHAEAVSWADADSRDRVGPLLAADLQLTWGDVRSASAAIRRIRRGGGLDPAVALRFAHALRRDDPQLARDLLRDASLAELQDAALPFAMQIARLLCMETEAKTFGRRFESAMASGGKELGGVTFTLEQFNEFAAGHARVREWLERNLMAGAVPIHTAAPALGLSLAELYHADFVEREADPTATATLAARHGGRQLPAADAFPATAAEWRLHMDVTSILLTEHLGLLDRVERMFAPIGISSALPQVLAEMLDDQGAKSDAAKPFRSLLEAEERGRLSAAGISLADALLPGAGAGEWISENISSLQGIVVCEQVTSDLAEGVAGSFVSLPTFREALNSHAQAAGVETASIVRDAGQEPVQLGEDGPVLFLGDAVLPLLDVDWFQELARRHPLYVEGHLLDLARRIVGAADRAELLVTWLERLRERISRGYSAGTYEFLPVSSGGAAPSTALEQCAGDLLALRRASGEVVWADDRMLGSFAWAGNVPTAGVADMLLALRSYGELSDAKFYGLVHRLRSAGFMYIEPFEGELLRRLDECVAPSAHFLATPEIRCVRRYLARALIDGGNLQRPGVSDSGHALPGEGRFLAVWNREAGAAVVSGWLDNRLSEKQRICRANWVMENLAVQRHASLPPDAHRQARREALSAMLASLVMQGIRLASAPGADWATSARSYLDWLDTNVLSLRFRADPDIAMAVGRILRVAFVPDDAATLDERARDVRTHLIRRLASVFPRSLSDCLPLHEAELATTLGVVEPREILALGGQRFDPRKFWVAAAAAVGGKPATAVAISGVQATLTANRSGDTGPWVVLLEMDDGTKVEIHDLLSGLLEPGVEARARIMRDNPDWFDLPTAEFDAAVDGIAAEEDVCARMDRLHRARSRSAAFLFNRMFDVAATREGATYEDVQPESAESLTRHLRLFPLRTETFDVRLQKAAADLVRECGLDETFLRLSGLPTPVPAAVLEGVDLLPAARRVETALRWASSPSPMAKLHALRVFRHLSSTGTDVGPEMAAAIDLFMQEIAEGGGADAFLATLRACATWMREWRGVAELEAGDRMAICWTYADRLWGTLASVGISPEAIIESLGDLSRSTALHLLFINDPFRNDVTFPEKLTRRELAVKGLAYALGPEAISFMTAQAQDALRTAMAGSAEPGPALVLSFMRDSRLAGDALRSFFAPSLDPDLLSILGPEMNEAYSGASLTSQLERALGALALQDADRSEWLRVFVIAGDLPLQGLAAGLLAPAVRATSLAGMLRNNVESAIIAAHLLATQASAAGDPELVEAVFTRLLEMAAEVESADPVRFDKQTVGKVRGMLLAACLHLAHGGTLAHRVERAMGYIRRLLDADRHAASQVRHLLWQLCRELPFDDTEAPWSLLIRARSL